MRTIILIVVSGDNKNIFVFPESTDKLNKYLFLGDFLMEPLVTHPVMEIWMKTILA
jgi:hypothetical protein